MYQSHPRYSEIHIEPCTNECPQGGPPLKVVLFPREEDLRAHVVKHMLNTYEYEQAWGRIAETPWEEFSNCVRSLQELGCPIVETERISCFTGSGRCDEFDKCGSFLTRLESVYLECTKEVIERAMRTPRYACFYACFPDSYEVDSFLWMQPDWKLTAKAVFENGTYVIMTCYSPKPGLSWQEIRDYVRREAQNEAFQRRVVWCTEETWAPELKKEVGGDDKETRRGGKGPRGPYVRSHKKKHWREYLSEYPEEEDER